MIHLRVGESVSIQVQSDPSPSVGRVLEIVSSDDPALYAYKLLVNLGSEYLPYWVHIDAQTRVIVLSIGETYRLRAGIHQGELGVEYERTGNHTKLESRFSSQLITRSDEAKRRILSPMAASFVLFQRKSRSCESC